MTKINEHGSTPPGVATPVQRHSSETVRSRNDAGGQVPPGQYRQPTPPAPTPPQRETARS